MNAKIPAADPANVDRMREKEPTFAMAHAPRSRVKTVCSKDSFDE